MRCTAAHLWSHSLNIVSLSDMIEGSYHSWDSYTTGQLVDGLQQKKKTVFSLNGNGIMSSFLGRQFYRSTLYHKDTSIRELSFFLNQPVCVYILLILFFRGIPSLICTWMYWYFEVMCDMDKLIFTQRNIFSWMSTSYDQTKSHLVNYNWPNIFFIFLSFYPSRHTSVIDESYDHKISSAC